MNLDPPEIPTEPDRIAGALVVGTLIAAIIAIAASALVVWLLASRVAHGGGRGNSTRLSTEPPADPFSLASAHEQRRADQRHSLDLWQWSDARHTHARMPIERAINQYLAVHQDGRP